MKLGNAKPKKVYADFIRSAKLIVSVIAENNRPKSIKVYHKGKIQIFIIDKLNPLKAWKALENFVNKK